MKNYFEKGIPVKKTLENVLKEYNYNPEDLKLAYECLIKLKDENEVDDNIKDIAEKLQDIEPNLTKLKEIIYKNDNIDNIIENDFEEIFEKLKVPVDQINLLKDKIKKNFNGEIKILIMTDTKEKHNSEVLVEKELNYSPELGYLENLENIKHNLEKTIFGKNIADKLSNLKTKAGLQFEE